MEKIIITNENRAWMTVSSTVNLGDYESAKIEAGYSCPIPRNEDPIDVLTKMEQELSEFVMEKANGIKDDYSDKIPKKKKK